mmetsp:Transcript_12181/g.32782  ORF Transcript_12181/g.32782 Transcript_12181/m.32782 type:complete len:144 (+) Transcript_12181:826-1257(+)
MTSGCDPKMARARMSKSRAAVVTALLKLYPIETRASRTHHARRSDASIMRANANLKQLAVADCTAVGFAMIMQKIIALIVSQPKMCGAWYVLRCNLSAAAAAAVESSLRNTFARCVDSSTTTLRRRSITVKSAGFVELVKAWV